ncbi:MAG: NADH-quinone oxidoreductase subunit N, partial [Magnetospirillum sp.]|nr:NADH-quinone oxidoreductase subunit N [Magnetospirillum sp.]
YIALERLSFTFYVLSAYATRDLRSNEAGVKYILLGAFSSALLLYGISLIYGATGTTYFRGIAGAVGGTLSPGLLLGLVLLIAGFAFKAAAVPFHMWAPDVYEGAPTPVTAFFAVAPKIAALCLLTRVLVGPFADLLIQWRQVVTFVAILSMVVGGFAGVAQTNVKRLMAYSSIGNVGFILVGVAAGTDMGIQGVLIYLAIYLFMTVGTFAVIQSMRVKGRLVEGIDDLAGLSKTHPMMAFTLAVLMFSMAGIPPLAGFWGKFYVFMAAIQAELYTLSILGVLTSVVSAFYYLRIVKVMYFDDAVETFDRVQSRSVRLVMVASTAVVLVFTFLPAPLVSGAKAAAAVLFPAG